MRYQPVIGMEVHVQPKTRSKMFCCCTNDPFCKRPNIHICPVCTGQPGALPVANRNAIEETIRFGLALNCQIAEYSCFDRKSYFYPDLPKGYQISQYDSPFCQKGFLLLGGKKIRVNRIHLEEDAGKNFHPKGTEYTLVDLNRAGVPLIELVTEPDMTSAAEARSFCQELQLILRYLNVSDADMEKGQMRCEANISLIKNSAKKKERLSGTKVEVKNLNSFKAVERSIECEIKRQRRVLERGERVVAETRGWSEGKQTTVSQRSKEEASDYRYFPEPDIPPIFIKRETVAALKRSLNELPAEYRRRLRREYGLNLETVEILVANKDLGEYFEASAGELQVWWEDTNEKKILPKDVFKLLANYIVTEIKKCWINGKNKIARDKCTPENLAELIVMLRENKINSSAAQLILQKMLQRGGDPSQIAEELDLVQVSDSNALEKVIKLVIKNNPGPIAELRAGKDKTLQFLIGQVMKETRGKANPQVAAKMIKKAVVNPPDRSTRAENR
ncbi:MAG: Asp-tRNA(Asn)/Glu-tRNA(Gln) amidotransferase subunit GatB [Candidatus Moranbacteria bacterium]|nr:Asp-tRNA(Asn)/Glu-tRNA(Gln) amidotransferase subunit GatB [Candidatus Moranbacteria bacterium]